MASLGKPICLTDLIKCTGIRGWNKKTDEEGSFLPADLICMNRLPRVYAYSDETDKIRSLLQYRATLGQTIAADKNQVHTAL